MSPLQSLLRLLLLYLPRTMWVMQGHLRQTLALLSHDIVIVFSELKIRHRSVLGIENSWIVHVLECLLTILNNSIIDTGNQVRLFLARSSGGLGVSGCWLRVIEALEFCDVVSVDQKAVPKVRSY